VNQRSDVGALLSSVTESQPPRLIDEHPEEVVMDPALQNEATGCRASLAGCPECAPEHTVEGQVQIGVVQHDLGVLAPHLERQPFVHPAAHLADHPPGLGRPRERDHRNTGMFDDGRPHDFAAAVQQLDHLGR
jgi:hypothetical protein